MWKYPSQMNNLNQDRGRCQNRKMCSFLEFVLKRYHKICNLFGIKYLDLSFASESTPYVQEKECLPIFHSWQIGYISYELIQQTLNQSVPSVSPNRHEMTWMKTASRFLSWICRWSQQQSQPYLQTTEIVPYFYFWEHLLANEEAPDKIMKIIGISQKWNVELCLEGIW